MPSLVSQSELAAAVEDAIAALADVLSARASPASGSLLVTFNPGLDPTAVENNVRRALYDLAWDSPSRSGPRPLRRVVELALPERGAIVRPGLLTIGAHSINLLQGVSIISMVTVAGGEVSPLLTKVGLSTSRGQLAALGASSLVMAVGEAWTQQYRVKAWRSISSDAEERIRNEVFRHLERQDIQYFGEVGTGPLLNLLTDHIQSIGSLIEGADRLIEAAVTVVVASSALFRATPRVAIIAAAAVPLILLPARVLGPKTGRAFGRRAQATTRLTQELENILGGIIEVKSFTAEEQEADRVAQLGAEVGRTSVEAASTAILQSTITRNILFGTSAAGTWYTARMTWADRMSQNQLTRVVFWIPRMMGAFSATIESSGTYYRAVSAAEQLSHVLTSTPRISDGATTVQATDLVGDIRLSGVSFGYDPTRPILHDISLQIRATQTLGVVGRTGSGKSTLVRLLLRFYDPDSGEILIAGNDIRRLALADLRDAISLVSQEVYLFDASLADNLRYGWPDASEDELLAALRAAGAGELVDVLPDGLNFRVGERGQRLSGGQRQRVALARALLKPAPILIIDEATSSLDYETEAAVKDSIKIAARGRTVIVVAHRLTSVRDADRIIVLDEGRIVEEGTHEELLEQQGLYFRLWQLQC